MKRSDLAKLASNIYRGVGDAIAGKRVIAQARNIGNVIVVPGTSRHRIKQTILRKNVLCVIDREFHIRDTKMRLK